jgi:hypothetical protein
MLFEYLKSTTHKVHMNETPTIDFKNILIMEKKSQETKKNSISEGLLKIRSNSDLQKFITSFG